MSSNPDPPSPPPPPPPPEGAQPGRPQPTSQPRPPQIPSQAWAQFLAAGGVRPSGLGIGLEVGPPMPVFLPVGGQLAQAQQTLQLWQGQYPPPEAIEHYEKVLPGAFDRMIAMAERLQAAQIDKSRRVHDYTFSDNRRGKWLGFSAAIIAMFCALGALAFNSPWVAAVFLSVPVMGVANALIESARKSSPADLLAAATNQPSENIPSAAAPPQQAS